MLDRALGSLYGAFLGDAMGAFLEFGNGAPSPARVDLAMSLPGGGPHGVAPGQITDDGEMTMALLTALAGGAGPDDLDGVARAYGRWVQQGPFDMGHTTRTALSQVSGSPAPAATARAAARRSLASQANGALMRVTPWFVWGARHGPLAAGDAASAEAALTHPHPACTASAGFQAVVGSHLVRGTSPSEALDAALAWLPAHPEPTVASWVDEALAGRLPAFEPQVGWVRIAFTHALHHLAAGTSWWEAVRLTLAGGGDTDTNASIVGGLLGARDGAETLPDALLEVVFTARPTDSAPAEDWLHPRHAASLVPAVLGVSPA